MDASSWTTSCHARRQCNSAWSVAVSRPTSGRLTSGKECSAPIAAGDTVRSASSLVQCVRRASDMVKNILGIHDDVITWKCFLHPRPFLWGFINHRWMSLTKGQWYVVLISLLLILTSFWTNNRMARLDPSKPSDRHTCVSVRGHHWFK